jgi:hypothetical protein
MKCQNGGSVLKWLAVSLTITSSLFAESGTSGLTKVTIGLSPFQDTLLPIIGKEKGWFEKEGLAVEFKTLAWNAIMPAVAANAVDVAVFKKYWNDIEAYPKNAAEVRKNILADSGYANWKLVWDNDNYYFVEVDKLIPQKVPYDAFWGDKVQEQYVKKYGADESGL